MIPYHQELLAHRRGQTYAAELYAPSPSCYLFGAQRQKHVAELLDRLVGVFVGSHAAVCVKLLIVVILYHGVNGRQQRVLLACDMHAAALAAFFFIRQRLHGRAIRIGRILRYPPVAHLKKIAHYPYGHQRAQQYKSGDHREPSSVNSSIVNPAARRSSQ